MMMPSWMRMLEQVEEAEGLGLGSLDKARLCQTLRPGTKLYCDRFFTSIQGAEQMMKKELYMTGTVMKNRVAATVQKLPTDKAMKKAGRGTSRDVSTEDGKLCVVKWYDYKHVLMMSVVNGTQPEDTCQRWDKKLNQYGAVSRPSIIREYNLKMGGPTAGYCTAKTLQYVVHQRTASYSILEFRMEVARTLLAQHHSQDDDADLSWLSEEEDNSKQMKNRPVAAVPHVSVHRRANAHLPEMISLKNATRCRAPGCSGRSRMHCVTCKVYLRLQADPAENGIARCF
ncbi:hypothetical protein Q8A73_001058 [Channa argus]|nr:hypothetical protein Q8A73_001058 [Channa argus]